MNRSMLSGILLAIACLAIPGCKTDGDDQDNLSRYFEQRYEQQESHIEGSVVPELSGGILMAVGIMLSLAMKNGPLK